MQIGTSGSHDEDMKQTALWVRSKVKAQGHTRPKIDTVASLSAPFLVSSRFPSSCLIYILWLIKMFTGSMNTNTLVTCVLTRLLFVYGNRQSIYNTNQSINQEFLKWPK